MDDYTVTYYEPIADNYVTEAYVTPELRNARIDLLLIMGYTITGTNDRGRTAGKLAVTDRQDAEDVPPRLTARRQD